MKKNRDFCFRCPSEENPAYKIQEKNKSPLFKKVRLDFFLWKILHDALHEISSAMGFLWLQPRIIKKDQGRVYSTISKFLMLCITPPLLIYELFNGHWPLDFFPSSLFVTRPTVSFAGILVYKVPTKGFLRPTFLWLVFQSIIAAYRYMLQLGIMHYLCILTKTMHF